MLGAAYPGPERPESEALAAWVPKRGCGGVHVPASKGADLVADLASRRRSRRPIPLPIPLAISPPISPPCDPPGMEILFAWRRRWSSMRRR